MILLLFPLGLLAQKPDTVKVKVERDFRPSSIRIGTDVLALARSPFDDTYTGWELNGDIDLDRYFFAVDIGSSSRSFKDDSSSYSNDGYYFRVGADYNFIHKDKGGNVAFFGLRYGHSIFSEQLESVVNDPVWGHATVSDTNTDTPAGWFEMVGGIKVRIFKIVWLGYTARYKFFLKTKDTTTMEPHDVPGYGRTDKNTTWGFNYQVLVNFPLRKKR